MADTPDEIDIQTSQVESVTTDGDTIKMTTSSVKDQIAADLYKRNARAQVFAIHRRIPRRV